MPSESANIEILYQAVDDGDGMSFPVEIYFVQQLQSPEPPGNFRRVPVLDESSSELRQLVVSSTLTAQNPELLFSLYGTSDPSALFIGSLRATAGPTEEEEATGEAAAKSPGVDTAEAEDAPRPKTSSAAGEAPVDTLEVVHLRYRFGEVPLYQLYPLETEE